jgi:hypothetical protein
MMFRGGILMCVALLGGCAAQGPRPTTAPAPAVAALDNEASAALVFDPHLGPYAERVEIPRAPRQRGAFVGWQDLTTTFFVIRTDDRQTSDWTDRYERRTIMEKVGVSYR